MNTDSEKNTDEKMHTDREMHTDGHGQARAGADRLIPRHGGYRNTKTWQLADLIYDVPDVSVRSFGGRMTAGEQRIGPQLHPFAVGPWRAPGANMNTFALLR